MKFKRTNEVGKFEAKEIKLEIREQRAKMSFGSQSLHAPLKSVPNSNELSICCKDAEHIGSPFVVAIFF